ncbi:MAG: AI-2E family transporter [Acidobacteriota bacterium]
MNARSRNDEGARTRGARFLLAAASLVVVVAGLQAARAILLPTLSAVFLAILSAPLLGWLMRRGLPRSLAVLVTVLTNVAVLVAILFLVGGSVNTFTANLPEYRAKLEAQAQVTVDWLEAQGIDTSELAWLEHREPPTELMEEVDDSTDATSSTSGFELGRVIDLVANTLRGITYLVSNTMLVMLILVFLLFEAGGLPAKMRAAFPIGESGMARVFKAKREVQLYLGIKTLVSLVTGVAAGTWVALLGVDYPLLWGLIAFLFNYIPTLGSIIAGIAPVLLTLVDIGPASAAGVALGYVVINVILGNFVEPHLMGRQFGLSTLVVFLSLVFWGWLWGPVGMLLSVPLTMVVKILLENSPDLRWIGVLLGRPTDDPPTTMTVARQEKTRTVE